METPNIDRLATEGMVFDRAYHMGSFSGAVCMPSRRMIMSGRSLWHVPGDAGIYNGNNPNDENPQLVPPDLADYTMAAVFNRAGYDTMRTCKEGNSYEAANEKFTIRHDKAKRGGTLETGSAWHANRVLEFLDQRSADKDTDLF